MKRFISVIGVAVSLVSADEYKERSKPSYVLLPFGAYTEETGVQFGGVGMYFAPKNASGTSDGSLVVSGIATTEGQKMLMVGPSGSVDQERIDLSLFLTYSDWPANYYLGGNKPAEQGYSYEMEKAGAKVKAFFSASYIDLLPSVFQEYFKLGLQAEYERNTTTYTKEDSTVFSDIKLGGRRTGLGFATKWDSRDHKSWPTRGLFVTVGTMYFREAWGSQWNFKTSEIDARLYRSLPYGWILAMGGFYARADGDVPFDRLSMPDGSRLLRGLEKGRLRDKQELVYQSELRHDLPWKMAMVGFAEAGKVGRDFGQLTDNKFYYSFGGGLRISVNEERKLNFRLDVAHVDGGVGMAASFGEAF